MIEERRVEVPVDLIVNGSLSLFTRDKKVDIGSHYCRSGETCQSVYSCTRPRSCRFSDIGSRSFSICDSKHTLC